MSDGNRTGKSGTLGLILLGLALPACTGTRPVTPPHVPSPLSPPPAAAAKIPGTPAPLSARDRALGNFLMSQVALNQGDYETALDELAEAVQNDPFHEWEDVPPKVYHLEDVPM